MREVELKPSVSSYALALPLLLALGALLVYPIALLLLNTALLEVWTDPYLLGRLGWTLLQALGSSLLTALLGGSAGLVFARFEFWGRQILEALLGLPFVVPVIVAGIGFLALFGSRGWVYNLSDTPYLMLLANVFYNYGIVARSVSSAVSGMDRDLENAARLEGATNWQVLRFVTLPFALPALYSSAGLVFLYCFASFGVPLLLAPPQYATLEVEIYAAVQRLDLDTAGALSAAQLLCTGAATLLYTGAQARASGLALTGSAARVPARGLSRVWLALHIIFALTLTLAPLAAVLWRSLQSATGTLTLAHYLTLFKAGSGVYSSDLALAIFNNLRFAGLALLIAVPLGVTHAFAVWQTRSRLLDALSLLPLMVSATLLGVAYIVTFSAQTAQLWLLIAAYALTAYPFVTRAALTALRSLEPGILEAARVDGAGGWALGRLVTLPIIAPALRVGVAFAFAVVIGEFGATLVLQRPEWATLTTLIFEKLSRPAGLGQASALSSLLLLLTATGFWVIGRGRSS